MKSQNCWTNGPRPNLLFFFCFSFSPHVTWWHKANSSDTAPYMSSNDFSVFPLRHLVAQSMSPTYCPIGVRRIFLSYTTSWYILFLFSLFFFYTTSWHRVEVPDTLLKTVLDGPLFSFSFLSLHHLVAQFPFFLHPLVAQSRRFRRIAKNGPQQL